MKNINRFFVLFCFIISAFISPAVGSTDDKKMLEMLNSEGQLKFKNGCILATADILFCGCLSERVGSYLTDNFSYFAKGLSIEGKSEVRIKYLEAINDPKIINEMIENWQLSRDACRAISK